ncbi:21818_t:CDS:1 [Gigaspora margarita]|uniref:21818_t:CDS:1 n=1 Tax=Gigaspora margarita TaxID=4874 RepID=A0ABN7V1G0_GIGMA|nr:21818_t:CDS:1 [Gigaspora margarita]
MNFNTDMDLKRTIEVLKEIRNISQIAIQENQAMKREQTTKKAKKAYIEAVNLDNGQQEPILKSRQFGLSNTTCTITSENLHTTTSELQIITNVRTSSELSMKGPILDKSTTTNDIDITTNMGTNRETSMDIEIKNLEKKSHNLKKLQ